MVELRAVLGPAPEPAPDMAAVPEFMLLALALPAAYRVWPTGPLLAAGLAGSLLPAPSSWLLALQLLPPRGLLGDAWQAYLSIHGRQGGTVRRCGAPRCLGLQGTLDQAQLIQVCQGLQLHGLFPAAAKQPSLQHPLVWPSTHPLALAGAHIPDPVQALQECVAMCSLPGASGRRCEQHRARCSSSLTT
eukprot:CAMPEP_0202917572 /NCGR_PEP_ID=MMETSP1392-20130828/71304_1 /ASSEMBLY_ACC=CAM_ASM_000868 /TAXON_ID=225041 /ORGANISM="Chlamydomonas chlamydogama, Strain SAG 11-48b" /LENGTH=188 /DNA_ID=CAMNT_0049610359 /DNA_START=1025 /DNA_END=1592 /DNA_ORIENTATION=+